VRILAGNYLAGDVAGALALVDRAKTLADDVD